VVAAPSPGIPTQTVDGNQLAMHRVTLGIPDANATTPHFTRSCHRAFQASVLLVDVSSLVDAVLDRGLTVTGGLGSCRLWAACVALIGLSGCASVSAGGAGSAVSPAEARSHCSEVPIGKTVKVRGYYLTWPDGADLLRPGVRPQPFGLLGSTAAPPFWTRRFSVWRKDALPVLDPSSSSQPIPDQGWIMVRGRLVCQQPVAYLRGKSWQPIPPGPK
jgi:hypothetical protein